MSEFFGKQPSDVTAFLNRWNCGDQVALDDLLGHVYKDLKAAANFYLNKEKKGHTLQPTALINEVYLRLRDNPMLRFENRAQFFAFAGRLMRQILVGHARSKGCQKRGGDQNSVPMEAVEAMIGQETTDLTSVLAVDNALKQLEAIDERQARIVELRFFAGLSMTEIAETLEISEPTVYREWRIARMVLARVLKSQ